MKLALILLAIAAIVIATVLLRAPASAARSPADNQGRAMYESLRTLALSTRATDLGIAATGPEPAVYGIVWDMDVGGETATITSFETGDASLYLSTGGGIIGGGTHAAVAAAARRFVAAARTRLGDAAHVEAFPRPHRGEDNFYILTSAGVFAANRPEAALRAGTDPWSPMFAAGQDVITQLRLIPPEG